MKVAFVAQPVDSVRPPVQNSIGITVYQLARHLSRLYSVSVYLKGEGMKIIMDNAKGVEYRYIPMILDKWIMRFLNRIPYFFNSKRPLFSSKLHYLGYALQIALDLKSQKCDVVHIINFSQFVPIIRTFNPNIKIILNMRCEWLTQLDHSMIEKRLSHVDLILGVSEYITRKIQLCFPLLADKCQTLHNAVDSNLFIPQKCGNKKETDHDTQIIFVGRVSPEKGVHVLIKAFQHVVERFPHVQLNIVGSQGQLPYEYIVALSDDKKVSDLAIYYTSKSQFEYSQTLKEMVNSMGLENNVFFLRYVPQTNLLNYYRNADILVNPSLSESFGNTLIEAMATETAVIASHVGGMTEIVENGISGILVESDNVEALAEAITRLLSDHDLMKSIAKKGLKRADEVFSWEKIADTLRHQYRSLFEDVRL